jgi:hypothetical protein
LTARAFSPGGVVEAALTVAAERPSLSAICAIERPSAYL